MAAPEQNPAMTARVRSACFALALASGTHAFAEVHEALDYENYIAQAQPGRAVALALNQASPFRPGGQVYHSATAWFLDWKVRPQPTVDGRCRVGEVRIELHGRMVLPRLTGASSGQQRVFDDYLVHLREHELGHFEIGREAARELEREFYALPPARDCSALEAAARYAGARMLPKYEAMGDTYDQQTGHGRTQGAWLTE
jgi:predicted secreted Zn-dependent protease